MKLSKYIKDKVNFIISFIIYCIIIVVYMNAIQIDKNIVIVLIVISNIFFLSGFLINYFVKNRYIRNIEKIMDKLQEKYLICEIIEKPRREENLAYYRILKKANSSMIENIMDIKLSKRDYKEYIESWVHEVKIPITSVKLLCENNKSEITNKIDEEIEQINNYIEQVLFYARLEQVSNDFMIKKINIQEIVKNILAKNKKIMIQNNMKIEIKNINVTAYTDEKWLEFILNQIIINAIKYKKPKDSKISITTQENKENIQLIIKDNGIGIKKSEIERIFDKGFTGTNGRNQKRSTGIGLYLCKKLCEELGMAIEAESEESKYTEIKITISRTNTISDIIRS